MRILHTTHSYAPERTGVAEVVGQISRGLARRGHEVHVGTARSGGSAAEEVLDGVIVHRFGVTGNGGVGLRGDVNGYRRFVAAASCDILAMHCAQSWSTDALLPRLDALPGKKVFIGHGLSALKNSQYAEYFRSLAQALRRVDRVVVVSSLLEESGFCAAAGLPRPLVIPNGVDPEEWATAPRNLRERWGIENRFWLLSLSNHSPVKGHATIFRLMRTLRREGLDAVATIVGEPYPAAKWGLGDFGIKGGCWYRCVLAASGRTSVVLRTGVTRGDVVSAVQEADLLLVTSTREASPLVVFESMAAGRPWVSFDLGGVRENKGGAVVRSSKEMAHVVMELSRDSGQREALGREGQRQVRRGHDWAAITSAYEDLYRALTGEGERQPPAPPRLAPRSAAETA